MKNSLFLTTFFGILSLSVKAQGIGINTSTPLTTLHIATKNPSAPTATEGIIIPRVNSLNTTDTKPIGLLVFLNNENTLTPEIERGFYWWDGIKWVPFFSMNKLKKDETITYVSCQPTFREGNITSATSTNTRTMQFNASTLLANDSNNFEINSNNELVVKKAGTYHVQAVVSLKSVSNDSGRDSYEAMILVNGNEPSPNLRTAYGFPSGGAEFDSNTAISGFVTLQTGNTVSIRINRYYRNAGTTVTITPNGSLSNLTLRYMGNL